MKVILMLIILLPWMALKGQSFNQAMAYYNDEDYELAAQEFEKLLPKARKKFGQYDTVSYAGYVSWTAVCYEKSSQYALAEKYYREALDIYSYNKGENSESYCLLLNNLASVHYETGRYETALLYMVKALQYLKDNRGENHPEYGVRLNNIGQLYGVTGHYSESLKFLFEAKDNIAKVLGKNHSHYGACLNNIALVYNTLGQYDKARPILLESVENCENTLGKNHSEYISSLNNLGMFYRNTGDYEKSIQLHLEALELAKSTTGENSSHYGVSLSNLSDAYSRLYQFEKAEIYAKEALAHSERIYGKDHTAYALRLGILARLYANMGNYKEALPLFIESLRITEKKKGKKSENYITGTNNLALFYQKIGNYISADSCFKEALALAEAHHGCKHKEYAVVTFNLGCLYEETKQVEKAFDYYSRTFNNSLNYINSTFKVLSESEKEMFILTVASRFKVLHSFFTKYRNQFPEGSRYAYNIEISTKGIILQSGINLKHAVLAENEPAIIEKYEQWTALKNELSKAYANPKTQSTGDLEKLESQADKAESEIHMMLTGKSDLSGQNIITYADILAKLKPHEVAVEFASFRYHNGELWTDSILYTALVLLPNDSFPKIINLCEQKQLDALISKSQPNDATFINSIYRGASLEKNSSHSFSESLYELIWKPIAGIIPEGSTVYYSPSGTLHMISFAALKRGDNKLLSDIYRLVQVSSTAKILDSLSFKDIETQNIVLFGGILYDNPEKQASIKTEATINTNPVWNYLPGTLSETENILKIAQEKGIKAEIFSGLEATEGKFKSFSSKKSPRILHLASHAFFYPEQIKKEGIPNNEGEVIFKASDNPLNRTGILFAGANNKWQGESIPDLGEDGILTAYEASCMYLGNTQLVVLSACETGLGDIKGNEGVFGLQRAFKMAGAEYLLMSLWKVPDKETSEYMTYFYSHLLSGKNIPESFYAAQEKMKVQYKDEPYKWAAFILVK